MAPQQPYTILIVEDSATMRYAYSQVLEERYHLIFADNPLTALTEVATKRPDVVLLDINLRSLRPTAQIDANQVAKYMDGLDVCAAIKRSPYKDIPVILLTERDGLIDKVRGKLARADCYLTKPISSDFLIAKVRDFLTARSGATDAVQEAGLQPQAKSRLL